MTPSWYIRQRQQEEMDKLRQSQEQRRIPPSGGVPLSAPSPTPQGLQLNWMPGIGGEGEGGEQQSGGMNDIGALLGQYLKKRQGASPADAKAAFEAGGSL